MKLQPDTTAPPGVVAAKLISKAQTKERGITGSPGDIPKIVSPANKGAFAGESLHLPAEKTPSSTAKKVSSQDVLFYFLQVVSDYPHLLVVWGVREQLAGIDSLHSSCEFWGSNSYCQAWQQVPLATEPFHWLGACVLGLVQFKVMLLHTLYVQKLVDGKSSWAVNFVL